MSAKRPPRDRSQLTRRLAATLLSELIKGPVTRAEFIARNGTSNAPTGLAIRLLRQSGVIVDNVGEGGRTWKLHYPHHTKAMLRGALRLNMGDLIESGGIAPAVGIGMLIDAGAMAAPHETGRRA